MKKLHPFIVLGLIATALCQTTHAAMPGEALVEMNCQGCHDNSIFTRDDSIIHSYPELQARVEFCENVSKAHWNNEQINQVIEYLNSSFCKFPKP